MDSRGAGRGRGRGTSQPRQPSSFGGLRKPGEPRQPVALSASGPERQSSPIEQKTPAVKPTTSSASELRSVAREVINEAALSEDNNAIAKAAKRLHEAARSDGDMETIAGYIMSLAEEDSEKPGICASLACQLSELSLKSEARGGVKGQFRTQMLRLCQKRFRERERLRGSDAYCGFVSLLALIFCRLRLESGGRVEPLAEPVVDCLVDMVNGEQSEELDCCIYLLEELGPAMDECAPRKMDELLHACRERLCAPECRPWHRAYLAQILELRAGAWKMERPVLAYYARKCNDLRLQ